MEARCVGILFLALSATLIPDLFRFPSVWTFFIPGVLAGVLALSRFRYWKVIALVVCVAYLAHQLPPLVRLSMEFGFLHFLGVVTESTFRNGVSLFSAYTYWHLALMPLIVILLCGFLVWVSAKEAREKWSAI
jgi:hypothetical protein